LQPILHGLKYWKSGSKFLADVARTVIRVVFMYDAVNAVSKVGVDLVGGMKA
jgi:hypothetical protein